MSELYNYEYYHCCCGPIAYEDPAHWVEFFGDIADLIVQDLKPKTVLDAGCAMGYLVAALRDRGVEAYGVDISEYAISKVREDIRPYCAVGSLTEPLPDCLPRQYDLVVTIEVLEHLYEKDGKQAIQNLCTLSDCIIFSSTPYDFTEKTHFNVQQREYWAQLFAAEGFFDDLNYRPTYLTQYASCFKKSNDWMQQIGNYERNIRIADSRILELSAELSKAQRVEYLGKVYFDCGSGLREEDGVQLYIDENHRTGQRIDLPGGCYAVRLDPVEGCGCLIWNLQVRCEGQFLKVSGHNGISLNDVYIFRTTDPQIYFEPLPAGSKWLEIEAEIVGLEQGAWTKLVEEVEEIERNQAELLAEHERQAAEYAGVLQQAEEEKSSLSQNYEQRIAANLAEYQAGIADKERELSEISARKEAVDRDLADLLLELADTAEQKSALEQELKDSAEQRNVLEQELEEIKDKKSALEGELAHYQEHYHAAINQREELKQQLAQAQYAYNVISNAFFWKITKPFRVILDRIKSLLRRNQFTRLACKGLKCWKENGFSYTWKKVQDRRRHRQDFAKAVRPVFTLEELEQQKKDVFPRNIKFSILVPLYNTPERFLHEMIRSVLDQTYSNWELCMADGSDSQHKDVERICKSYRDSRVRYKKLEKNLGISENTNACIEMATGDYIALLDHDDLLHPAALHEVMRAICEQDADFVYTDEATFESPNVNKIITMHFKPDYAPDNLRANNYICHFSVFAKTVLDKAGYFRKAYDGSQDHDMVLRITEEAKKIVHIPNVLYYWRSHPQSVSMDVSSKSYAVKAGKDAVRESILRCGDEVEVESSRAHPTIYRLKYRLKRTPKVSIIIPNKNHVADIKLCINSILSHTTYQNYEIVIVDNGSSEPEVFDYYHSLKNYSQIKICSLNIDFNYSKLNNFGAQQATGEYYILLNNDTEIITPEWVEEMLMFCQREDVGAVGAKLYYPDNTIQHAGIILGLGADRVAGHPFCRWGRDAIGYMGRLCYAQNMSAVTAACMMVKATVYQQLGGLDESFEVAYNDVDLCLRIRQAGYLIVWTPFAELYHYESKTRGLDDTPEKRKRFEGEVKRFQARWAKELSEGDPYYNPNLTLDREDFSLR